MSTSGEGIRHLDEVEVAPTFVLLAGTHEHASPGTCTQTIRVRVLMAMCIFLLQMKKYRYQIPESFIFHFMNMIVLFEACFLLSDT